MQMSPYLSFNGECEAVFKSYEQYLGGQSGAIFRYGESPMAEHMPAGWADKVMHCTITIGDQVLMGADAPPGQYEEPKGFSLSLHVKSTEDAERIFDELARGGQVVMPLEKTFWAARFGMLVDRFGIPWMVNCEGTDQPAGA